MSNILTRLYRSLSYTVERVLELGRAYDEAYGLRSYKDYYELELPVEEWVTCGDDPVTYGFLGCQPGLRLYVIGVFRYYQRDGLWLVETEYELGRRYFHSFFVPRSFAGLLVLYPLIGSTHAWEELTRRFGIHARLAEYVYRIVKPSGGEVHEGQKPIPKHFGCNLLMVNNGAAWLESLEDEREWLVVWANDKVAHGYPINRIGEWPQWLVNAIEDYASGRLKALGMVNELVQGTKNLLRL